MGDPTYGGDLQASTLDDMVADIAYQNFFVDTPKQAWFRAVGAVDPFGGGVLMREPFIMNRPQGGATHPGTNFNITQIQQLADLAFNMRLYSNAQLAETFMLNVNNRGIPKKVDLYDMYIQQSISAINTDVEVDSYHHGQAPQSGFITDNGINRVNGDAEAMNDGFNNSWDGNVFQNYGNQIRNGAVSSTINSIPFWYGNSNGSGGTISVDALIQHYLRVAQFSDADLGIISVQGWGYILGCLQRQQRFIEWSVKDNKTVPDWKGIDFMGCMIYKDIQSPGVSWGTAFPSTITTTSNATSTFTSAATCTGGNSTTSPTIPFTPPFSTTLTVGEVLFFYNAHGWKYRPPESEEFFFGVRKNQVWNNNTLDAIIVNLGINIYTPVPRENNHGYGIIG
jgi:hypothetical protein